MRYPLFAFFQIFASTVCDKTNQTTHHQRAVSDQSQMHGLFLSFPSQQVGDATTATGRWRIERAQTEQIHHEYQQQREAGDIRSVLALKRDQSHREGPFTPDHGNCQDPRDPEVDAQGRTHPDDRFLRIVSLGQRRACEDDRKDRCRKLPHPHRPRHAPNGNPGSISAAGCWLLAARSFPPWKPSPLRCYQIAGRRVKDCVKAPRPIIPWMNHRGCFGG